MKIYHVLACVLALFLLPIACGDNSRAADKINLTDLDSPIILHGDKNTAYRDATAIFHDRVFYVYITMIRTEEENRIYSYTALSRSSNLRDWSKPVILTPKGQRLNYSSPGNVIRYGDEWIICLQSYPGRTTSVAARSAGPIRLPASSSCGALTWSIGAPPSCSASRGPTSPLSRWDA